jgi:hypothetical protein
MLKEKREGRSLEIKTFVGQDGNHYLVLRSLEGSFHTFVEVESKQAARECGATEEPNTNTRQMWESIWNNNT